MGAEQASSGEASQEVVRVGLEGGVAVLTIDNAPANTLNFAVRSALIAALEWAERSTDVHGVVLTGARGRFSAGADLAEFDSGLGLAEPSLHATILDFLDAMTKPVVAAIAGVALGGGLELALGCHYRVVAGDARLGLPESTFGFMPGAGGTQRLPRAVGLGRALDLILSGRAVDAEEAERIGLVTAVTAPGAHLGRALELAESLAAFPQDTLLADRRAAIEGLDLPLADGLALEHRLGRETLAAAARGANRFAAGEGRHGAPATPEG